jgi:hypothetical protein
MRNSVDDSFLVFTIHGEHKRALQFHNDTEKFGVLTATHPHKSTEKLSEALYTPHRDSIRVPRGTPQSLKFNPTRLKLCAVSLVTEAMAVVIRCLQHW